MLLFWPLWTRNVHYSIYIYIYCCVVCFVSIASLTALDYIIEHRPDVSEPFITTGRRSNVTSFIESFSSYSISIGLHSSLAPPSWLVLLPLLPDAIVDCECNLSEWSLSAPPISLIAKLLSILSLTFIWFLLFNCTVFFVIFILILLVPMLVGAASCTSILPSIVVMSVCCCGCTDCDTYSSTIHSDIQESWNRWHTRKCRKN